MNETINDIKRLEMLSESIGNEVDELQSLLENSDKFLLKSKMKSFQNQLENIISNLESANDSIYGVFEDLNSNDIDALQSNFNVLYEVLHDKLTYEEKIDMRIKYSIEFY